MSTDIVNVPQGLKDEIWDYCRLNNITNIDQFTINLLKQGFAVEKYGTSPMQTQFNEPQVIEKEVVKEIIKEVPVEKIVEVIKYVDREVIKEVPVEKIVEKIVNIYDNTEPQIIEKEVIKEVIKEIPIEKIIVDDPKIKSLQKKIKTLESKLEEEKNKKPNDDITQLFQKIQNLEALLEIEKNRNKNFNPKDNPLNQDNIKKSSAINWISKEEREKDNLYNE